MLAAGGIKAPLIGPEHRRLQDVSAAPVVLETAVIKVHRKAKGLEIESHCKNTKGTISEQWKRGATEQRQRQLRETKNGECLKLAEIKWAAWDDLLRTLCFFCFFFLFSFRRREPKLYNDLKCFHNNSVHCIRDTFTVTDCVISASAAGFLLRGKAPCWRVCCTHCVSGWIDWEIKKAADVILLTGLSLVSAGLDCKHYFLFTKKQR